MNPQDPGTADVKSASTNNSPSSEWDAVVSAFQQVGIPVGDELNQSIGLYNRLLRQAAAKIGSELQRQYDADDIVQSAIRTFLRACVEQGSSFTDKYASWPQAMACLISITNRKVAQKVRKSRLGTQRPHEVGDDKGLSSQSVGKPEGNDAEVIEFCSAVFQEINTKLNETDQRILSLWMMNHEKKEISELVNLSVRSVELHMKGIADVMSKVRETYDSI